jgi:hypothetical protein
MEHTFATDQSSLIPFHLHFNQLVNLNRGWESSHTELNQFDKTIPAQIR